jgi:large subunit ribosomal protein L13
MIIDGTDYLLGRLASVSAKNALLGQSIDIINCEKIVISGNRDELIDKFKNKATRGIPAKGPFIHRHPEKFVRRAIRGMLPYKKSRGRDAFSRVKCHVGVPQEFEKKKVEKFKDFHQSKLPNSKFVYVQEICKELGAR